MSTERHHVALPSAAPLLASQALAGFEPGAARSALEECRFRISKAESLGLPAEERMPLWEALARNIDELTRRVIRLLAERGEDVAP